MAKPRGHKLSPNAWDDSLKHAGINLTEAAERAGANRATVSGLLGGHARASLPLATRLAAALGVHVETLFPTMRPCFGEIDDVEVAA